MPGDQLCLLERIEVLALEVLLRADREHLLIADRAHDHGQQTRFTALDTDAAPGHTAPVAVHELITSVSSFYRIALWTHNQHTLKANFVHGLRQLSNAVVIEGLPSLVWTILYQCVRHMLHLFTRLWLVIDHLVNRRFNTCLATPRDPLAAFAAHD